MDPIYKFINGQLLTIDHEASVHDAALKLRDEDVHALVVSREGDYVGIITDADLVRKVVAEGRVPEKTAVSVVMEQPIIILDQNLPMSMALQAMKKNKVRHIVATRQTRVTGVLSAHDFMRHYCTNTKDPIAHFWSNYECFLDEDSFKSAIDDLLRETVEQVGTRSATGQAIKDNKPIEEITRIAKREGLLDLAQILELQEH